MASFNLAAEKGGAAKTFNLSGKTNYYVGRTDTADIILPHSWVSRKHAMIQVEENGAHNIIDLGSANGTFVNSKQIFTPIRLRSGDKVSIGKTMLIFEQEEEPLSEATLFDEDDADEKTVAFVQREIVTVLICDIHDYTSLSEIIGDALISKLIRKWSSEVGKIVQHNEGLVDKFLGDAVMAMWTGGPSVGHNIVQALKTIREISIVTAQLGEKIPEIPWKLSIGAAINTGEAMLGNIGSNGKRDFTVLGDAVNVAFRLESMTTKTGYDLLIGTDATSQLKWVDDYFETCSYHVKGKKKKITSHGCSLDKVNSYLERIEKD